MVSDRIAEVFAANERKGLLESSMDREVRVDCVQRVEEPAVAAIPRPEEVAHDG